MIKKLNALVPITGSEHWIGGLKKLDARSFAAIRVHVRIKLIKAGTVSHLRRRCSRRLVIRGHALLWIQINRKLKRKVRSRGRGTRYSRPERNRPIYATLAWIHCYKL